MSKYDYTLNVLPDIEMYAGDTAPWVVYPMDEHNRIRYESLSNYVNTLTIMPFTVSAGISANAMIPQVVLRKTGNADSGDDGYMIVTYTFSEGDTKSLRGKYVYQIEMKSQTGSVVRIGQGNLYIKQNINR